MSARTIVNLPCWVRVDIWWWYELTSPSGTSWHGYELRWVRVDIYCVVIDVNSYHHFILALLGTSWHHLWYELTSLVVRVDICWWYELTWVRVDMGTSWHGASWHGYELTVTPQELPTNCTLQYVHQLHAFQEFSRSWKLYTLRYISYTLDSYPLGTRRCCDVKSTSPTLIQRRNNVTCPVGRANFYIIL